MEEVKKKKSNKGLIVLVVVLIILLLGSIGYICYDKLFSNEKPTEEKPNTIETPKENLITENTFKLSDINCVGTDTDVCEKTVKLSYNNANHNVKLIKKLTDSTKYSIEVYIDDQLIDTLDGGEFYSWNDGDKATDWLKNLDGYIYVIDSKYLGIVYRVDSAKPSWLLKFYDDTKPFENNKKIMVANYGGSLVQNNKTLTDLDALEFDGTSIKYWYYYCGDDIETDDGYVAAQQHSVTFDGNKINNTVIKTIKDAIGGGQHSCEE